MHGGEGGRDPFQEIPAGRWAEFVNVDVSHSFALRLLSLNPNQRRHIVSFLLSLETNEQTKNNDNNW